MDLIDRPGLPGKADHEDYELYCGQTGKEAGKSNIHTSGVLNSFIFYVYRLFLSECTECQVCRFNKSI